MQEDVRMFPNIVTPANPVIFDEEVCTGCNICVDVCVMDILMPNPEKGKPQLSFIRMSAITTASA